MRLGIRVVDARALRSFGVWASGVASAFLTGQVGFDAFSFMVGFVVMLEVIVNSIVGFGINECFDTVIQ